MIAARGIIRRYGSLEVLKGIDLDLAAGEIVSITGASGAGKTTLLQILSTLDQPDKGRLELNGVEVTTLSGRKLANFRSRNIGYVFQFHHLLEEFTASENVALAAMIAGLSKRDAIRAAEALLSQLGLEARLNHKPSELSGGEQQRTAVARALINNPAIVFADEPSGNLDSHHAGELHDLFFHLREKTGQTFVIVTHNPELANRADRQLRLVDGQIS
jgi:lipoprotein-releasing system ATP-binding protein